MKAAGIYFDVRDDEYFSRLGQYMILKYPMYFTIVSEKDGGNPVYVVTDYLNKRNSRNIIVIKDGDGDIPKYMKASDICMDMIGMIFGGDERILEPGTAGPNLVCVTSAAGGSGKTTVAKALAACYMNQGYKVLYINTDTASAGEMATREDKYNNLDRLMYYLKSDNDRKLLQSLAETEIESGLECICNRLPSPENPPDSDMTELLMSGLLQKSCYEHIIIDCPSCLSESLAGIIKGSDSCIVVCSGRSETRERRFFEYLHSLFGNKITEAGNMCNSGDIHIPDIGQYGKEAFNKAISDLMKGLVG